MSYQPHQHPSFKDRWDPYRDRQYIGHRLDNRHFEPMLGCDANGKALHNIDALGGGHKNAAGFNIDMYILLTWLN